MAKLLLVVLLITLLTAVTNNHVAAQMRPNPQEPECVEPIWPMPDGAASIRLSKTKVDRRGERITGSVTVKDLKLLTNSDKAKLGPLLLILENKTREVVRFETAGGSFLQHQVDASAIAKDGSYSFTFQAIGARPGQIRFLLGWKWRILTEGACAVAIDGVYAGCWIGGQLNGACVCATLAALPAPGSWACTAHPLTFRAVWAKWGCAGPSPY